jgi:hypothetical protein
MLLDFGGIAGAHIRGIFVYRQRRKFGVPYAHNADRQMRGQVDAAEKEDCPEDEVRGDGENTQRDWIDGDSANRASHQGEHGGQRQRGCAEHGCHGRKNFHGHAERSTTILIGNAAIDDMKLRDGDPEKD